VPRRHYAQFLELLFQDEIYVRHPHLINRRGPVVRKFGVQNTNTAQPPFLAALREQVVYRYTPYTFIGRFLDQIPIKA
jgi:hypothetical protein